MGNQGLKPVVYSVKHSDSDKEGQSGIYRHELTAQKELVKSNPRGDNNIQELLLGSQKSYGNLRCLGTKNANNEYQWKSYSECVELARDLGSGIQNLNLAPVRKEYKDFEIKFLAIYSKNREEYVLTDMAAALYGYVTVPIYDTLGQETLEQILEETNLTTIICSDQCLQILKKNLDKLKSVENIVCFDKIQDADLTAIEQNKLKYFNFQDIVNNGKQQRQDLPKIKSSDILTFSYTSGTTGRSKGAMLSHQNLLSSSGSSDFSSVKITSSDCHLSYLPLAHIYEKSIIMIILYQGARIGFYNGDMLKLKEDLAHLQPTIFPSVPRLHNKFYDGIKAKLGAVQGCKKSLVESAVKAKLSNLKSTAQVTHSTYDKLVFNKVKTLFGGKVKLMLSGAAPISADVLDFLKIASCSPILEGYGMTESTGGGFLTHQNDPSAGHVGGVLPSLEFKLEDVKEMNYTSKDLDADGNPQPRGELCLRGPTVFQGYYKQEEKTKEAIDDDGWLHTGDIVRLNKNGSISIIDRKKNIFKLAQGEYVAAEKIEIVLTNSSAIDECFIYGDSMQSFLVAVILPNKNWVMNKAQELQLGDQSFEQLINNPLIIKALLKECDTHGRQKKLLGFELPKSLYCVDKSFADFKLLTTTHKLIRHEAKSTFEQQIQKMYANTQL